jgi:hypothetical protein
LSIGYVVSCLNHGDHARCVVGAGILANEEDSD